MALGVPQLKTVGHELAHWHISDADKSRYRQQSATSELVDRAFLTGLAPQTVMAVAHGHRPTLGNLVWDATLFGGPTLKLARGAREAARGIEVIRSAREARVARNAAADARRAANVYEHPTQAWLEATEAKRDTALKRRMSAEMRRALRARGIRF